jgi:Rieske Fe-S protein
MKCTHQENALTATPEGLHCSAHGSSFDLEGRVTKEPALAPLQRFAVKLENDHLSINLKS